MSPKKGLYFIRKIHLPTIDFGFFLVTNAAINQKCDACQDGPTQEEWQVNSLLKIMDKISFATQCYSVFHSLFLVFLHKKCLAMLCSVSFTIRVFFPKKKPYLSHLPQATSPFSLVSSLPIEPWAHSFASDTFDGRTQRRCHEDGD